MTGRDLKVVRETLGLDPFVFAAVIGVHVSTVYRWEATRGALALDVGVARILDPLCDHVTRIGKASERLGKKAHDAMIARGPLAGLYVIIGVLLEETK